MEKMIIVKLNSREKKELFDVIARQEDKKSAYIAAVNYCEKKGITAPGNYNGVLSVALAFFAFCKADKKDVTGYIRHYANFKKQCYYRLSDFGAFGDLAETLARLACKPRNLWSLRDIHVKRAGDVDIVIRGKKFELGTNGKTFSESTENDAMTGKYSAVCYGVFTNDEKRDLFNMAIMTPDNAIKNFANMFFVFPDKIEFYDFMTQKIDNKPWFKFKPNTGRWQIVYYDSRAAKFIAKTDEYNIMTLSEYIAK
jgi:hypothetical protein